MEANTSDHDRTPGPDRVANDDVWGETKLVFGASALLFLVTVGLGFLNVFTTGALPRWQALVHLHSGMLGWLTLSAFGATVWLFTGDRTVSDAYVDRVRWLARAMVVTFVGLIASFGIAFSQGGEAFSLLAAFAPLAALTIWATAGFFLQQLGRLSEVTTAHLSTAAGFSILALAVTFATVVALGHAGVVAAPGFLTTAHVFGILGYEVLVIAGLLEWLVLAGRGGRWTRAGALQVAVGVLLGLLVPLLLLLSLTGLPGEVLTVLLILGLNAGIVLFGLLVLGRIGRTALRTNPITGGVEAWTFFATLWFAVAVVLAPLRIALGDPDWWRVVNGHTTNVGVVTNLLFGVFAVRTRSAGTGNTWAQPVAMWLTNGGLVVFIALYVATGSTHGALLMGSGVLLGVGWALHSLRESPTETGAEARKGVDTTD